MLPRATMAVVLLFGAGVACDGRPGGDACADDGGLAPLLGDAALIRVDVFGDDARCDGAILEADGAAIRSETFRGGEPLRVRLPVGASVVALTVYADGEGRVIIGHACAALDAAARTRACLPVELVGDGDGAGDLDGGDGDRDRDDAAVGDLARCSADGSGCAAPAGSCCWGACVDIENDPANCGGCGRPCAAGQGCCAGRCVSLSSTSSCGGCGRLCRPNHASAASCDGEACGYTCRTGYADCHDEPPNLDGCESSLFVVENCGACGNRCDTAGATTAGCDGTTCLYDCAPGRANCASAAPDLDGCECATPGCCGSACQTTHDNGIGASYYDCVVVGRYTETQARKACGAYTGDSNKCTRRTCPGGDTVCSTNSAACVCWSFEGTYAGRVAVGGPGSCLCPSENSPTWD